MEAELMKLDREENALRAAELMERASGSLDEALPFVRRVFFDFVGLRQGETIMGCVTQKEWARKYMNRTSRSIRNLLTDGREKDAKRHRDARTSQKQLLVTSKLEDGTTNQVQEELTGTEKSAPIMVVKEVEDKEDLAVIAHNEHLLQGKLNAMKDWVRALQKLYVDTAPKKSVWTYMSDEQRTAYEKFVECEP